MAAKPCGTDARCHLCPPAVAERGVYLRKLCRGSKLRVAAYSTPDGGCPLASPRENIAVCSYEKGNGAVNRLVAAGQLHELCCVVVDEFHMLADEGRGPALEVSAACFLPSFLASYLHTLIATILRPVSGLTAICLTPFAAERACSLDLSSTVLPNNSRFCRSC